MEEIKRTIESIPQNHQKFARPRVPLDDSGPVPRDPEIDRPAPGLQFPKSGATMNDARFRAVFREE